MRLAPAALALVARQAEGGMRDALSLLDQVRAAAGDAPDEAAVAEALGAVDAAAISRICAALVHREGGALLAELEALHARGLEMKRVAEEIVRHLRNLVVAKLVPSAPLDLPDGELAEVRAQAAAADAAQLTRLFDLAQRSVVDVKLAEQPRYALEVALLEGVFLAPGAQVAELVARLEALARGAPLPPRSPPPAPPAAGGTTSGGGLRAPAKLGSPGCAAGAEPAPSGWRPLPVAADLPANAASTNGEAAHPERSEATPAAERSRGKTPTAYGSDGDRWRAAVDEVEKVSPMLAPMLKQAALAGVRDGEIAVVMPTDFLAKSVERRRAEVEEVLSRFLGRPTRLAISIGAVPAAAPQGASDATTASAAAPAASIAAAEAAEKQARTARVRDAARNHPNIREATRILDGGVEKIEEL
jgi:DNA polymerase III subunit gamma/tau